MKTITAYECDHCGRYKKTKRVIKDHEPICFKNPESKSCITCVNFSTDWIEPEQKEIRMCDAHVNLDRELKSRCPLYRNKIQE